MLCMHLIFYQNWGKQRINTAEPVWAKMHFNEHSPRRCRLMPTPLMDEKLRQNARWNNQRALRSCRKSACIIDYLEFCANVRALANQWHTKHLHLNKKAASERTGRIWSDVIAVTQPRLREQYTALSAGGLASALSSSAVTWVSSARVMQLLISMPASRELWK